MKAMLKKRIKDPIKRSHWSLKLAYKNMSIVTAYMVAIDHVKKDLRCLSEYDSLLSPNADKFMLCVTHPNWEGAYLYYDNNLGEFIRSGKVSGRGFKDRGDEHEKESKKLNASSNFYFLYPSQTLQLCNRRTQGSFESLIMYIAAGYDSSSEYAASVSKTYNGGGILIIDDDDAAQIKSSLRRITSDLKKFHSYLAYLMELGYDLAIRPSYNVSENPGFESIAGLFES
jgi:hypothetical protein